MISHRAALGIEGTWQAYFDLLVQAISEGDKSVKVVATDKSVPVREAGSVMA